MPPDDGRDYLDPDVPPGQLRKSATQLNQAYNLGVDPYTGKEINPSIAAARVNARMMEGLIPTYAVGGMGSSRPQDRNKATALRTGSGTPYDDPAAGGVHYRVPGFMSGDIYGGRVSRGDLSKIQAPGRADKKQELQGTAHDSETETRRQLATYEAMSAQVGPELTGLFNSLPSNQQADLLTKSPVDIAAALKNHPLRKRPQLPQAGNPVSALGRGAVADNAGGYFGEMPSMFPTVSPKGYGDDRPAADLDTSDYYEAAGVS